MLNALPNHRKEKGSRTRRIRIVDIVATDQNGEKSAVDFMVTRAKPRAREALQAAKAGEKMKTEKYAKFLQKCAEEDPHNPRLNTEVIPVVFETHGAAGPSACRLFSMTRHQFGSIVLPCEDKSGEQTFYAAWVHRVSSALQRGTAAMIHNIAEGARTTSRRSKDVEVEPGEQDAAIPTQTAVTAPEGPSSCADLTEDTAAESDDEAECTAQPEKGTATKGPLQKPVPSQVIMAAARTRVKEKKEQRTRGAHGATALNNINSNKLDSSDSDGSTCTIVAQDELSVE